MNRLVSEEDYQKAAAWFSEQYKSLPMEERFKYSIDERIVGIINYDTIIKSLEKQIYNMRRQQEIWKLALIEDYKKHK